MRLTIAQRDQDAADAAEIVRLAAQEAAALEAEAELLQQQVSRMVVFRTVVRFNYFYRLLLRHLLKNNEYCRSRKPPLLQLLQQL